MDFTAVKVALSEQLPAYHALVALKDPAEAEVLAAWTVQTSAAVSVTAPSDDAAGATQLELGVNRRDFHPALLNGIDLVPAETSAVGRYLWLVSGLSTVLAVLAILNLAAYWTARTTERAQEIQVRHAMGARVRDLLRLFASEAVPFLCGILLLAVPVASLQLRMLQGLEPFQTFLQNRLGYLEVRDFLPSLLLIAVIGGVAVFGPLLNVLRSSLRSSSFGTRVTTSRWRLAMVAIQWLLVAAVGSVAGASLLAGYRMKVAGWGGEGNPLIVRLPWSEKRQQLLDSLNVRATSAATVQVEPLGVLSEKHDAYVPGLDADARRLSLYENKWSSSAVAQLGVALRAGRVFEENSEVEAMVSVSYANALRVSPDALLNRPLIRIGTDGKELPARTIVGVLADLHYNDLRTPPEMVVYVPPAPGEYCSTLLLPQSERGRLDAMLREGDLDDPEIAAALSSVTSMQEIRDDCARTEGVLSFATFSYALLAMGLLMLGILAEARTELAQRGRELALVVSLGARLHQAVLYFLRAPLAVASATVSLVLSVAVVTRERWLNPFPLLVASDVWNISLVVLLVIEVFGLALICLAAIRLHALSLAELLRVER